MTKTDKINHFNLVLWPRLVSCDAQRDLSVSILTDGAPLLHWWRWLSLKADLKDSVRLANSTGRYWTFDERRWIRKKMIMMMMIGMHSSYLSHISHMRYVEKNLSCGEIPDFYAGKMWRDLKFLHMWRIFKISSHYQCREVSNFSTSDMCVMWRMDNLCCCVVQLVYFAIYAVLSRNQFCRKLRIFVWRKF